jgi:predicted anti-sigma-YlaC factor YlaD
MKEHSIVRDLLTLAAAGMLDPAQQVRVEAHLRHCEACRSEFNEWAGLAGALRRLPTPQAPARLALQTQRLLAQVAISRANQASRLGLACLVAFSWIATFLTVGFVRRFDVPLAQWLDISSTTLWAVYIGATWLTTALAAGLLGKRWRQEGRTI